MPKRLKGGAGSRAALPWKEYKKVFVINFRISALASTWLGFLFLAPLHLSWAEPSERTHQAYLNLYADARPQFPQLHAELTAAADRFALSGTRLLEGAVKLVPEIVFFDTPISLAAVLPYRDESVSGTYQYKAKIYISTGMMLEVFGLNSYSRAEQLEILKVIVAHEIGHAVEQADPQNVDQQINKMMQTWGAYLDPATQGVLTAMGRQSVGQFREVHADSVAVILAHENGVNPDYLHLALDLQDETPANLKDVLVTHPPSRTRSTFIDLALAQIRRGRGTFEPVESATVSNVELERLFQLKHRYKDHSVVQEILARNRTVDDVFDEYKKYDPTGRNRPDLVGNKFYDEKSWAMLHVLLYAAHRNFQAQSNLEPGDYYAFVDRFTTFFHSEYQARLLTSREVQSTFSEMLNYSREIIDFGSLQEGLARQPERHIRAMINALKQVSGSRSGVFNALPALVPIKKLVEFDPQFAADLYNEQITYHNGGANTLSRMDPSGQVAYAMLGNALHAGLLVSSGDVNREDLDLPDSGRVVMSAGKESTKELLTLMYGVSNVSRDFINYGDLIPIFVPRDHEPVKKSPQRTAQLHRIKSDPSESGKRIRSILNHLWNQRGYFGIFDLSLRHAQIDWEFIFAILDIPAEWGFEQLRESVSQLVVSPQYVETLQMINEAGKKSNGQRQSPSPLKFANVYRWWDGSLIDHLRENLDPSVEQQLTKQPDLLAIHSDLLATTVLMSEPEVFTDHYGYLLTKELNKTPIKSTEDLFQSHLRAFRETQHWRLKPNASSFEERSHANDGAYLRDERWDPAVANAFIKTVLRLLPDAETLLPEFWADLSRGEQRAYELLAIPHQALGNPKAINLFKYAWIDYSNRTLTLDNLNVLRSLTIIQIAPLDLVHAHYEDVGDPFKHFSFVGLLSDVLIEGFNSSLRTLGPASAKDYLVKQALQIFRLDEEKLGDKKQAAKKTLKQHLPEGVEKLRGYIWSQALSRNFSTYEKIQILGAMTILSSSVQTDEMLLTILEEIDAVKDPLVRERLIGHLANLLSSGAAYDAGLAVAGGRRVLDYEFQQLLKSNTTLNVSEFFKRVNAVIPQKSAERDRYLDDLGYRLRLNSDDTKAFVSMLMTDEFRSTPPYIVNLISGMQSLGSALDDRQTLDLLDYLLRAESELPPWVESKLLTHFSHLLENSTHLSAAASIKETAVAQSSTNVLKQMISHRVKTLTTEQRAVVTFAMLKSKPSDAIKTAKELIPRYYGYPVNSREYIQLVAFLMILPPNERLLGLSFILCNRPASGEHKEPDYAKVAELFKAPGLKLAQLLSIWKIFGDRVAKSLEHTKDKNSGLNRTQFIGLLEREADSDTLRRLEIEKNVASASLKTIAKGIYRDESGQRIDVAIALLNPYAEQQNRDNMRAIRNYVRELKASGVSIESKFFEDLLVNFEKILNEETDLRHEARKIKQAVTAYENISSRMAAELGFWRFHVPKVIEDASVSKRLLITEWAKGGIPFDELPEGEEKNKVGRLFIQSQLQLIFRERIINPDFHTGNVLVSLRDKKIYPIDWGQSVKIGGAEGGRQDPLYSLIQIFQAVESNDFTSIPKLMALLKHVIADGIPTDSTQSAQLQRRLREAMRGSSFDKRMQQVIAAFAESDLPLDSLYSLTAVKGLMMLVKENYVSFEEFKSMFKTEATRYVAKNHLGQFVGDTASAYAKGLFPSIFASKDAPTAPPNARGCLGILRN